MSAGMLALILLWFQAGEGLAELSPVEKVLV